jgi:hypothetical protein
MTSVVAGGVRSLHSVEADRHWFSHRGAFGGEAIRHRE